MSFKDYTSSIDILKIEGHDEVVGTPTVTILKVDSSNNVLLAKGTTVPTDNDNGYAVGCLFIDTTGGVGITLYTNEGDADNCDFNAILTPGGAITFIGSQGISFSSAVGSGVGSAAIFRFNSFSAAVGTATSTAFVTGSTYNIAVQIPGVGTAYLKATMAV